MTKMGNKFSIEKRNDDKAKIENNFVEIAADKLARLFLSQIESEQSNNKIQNNEK